MVSRTALESLSERVALQRDNLATEEATKHALVLPFISALGYDIFDPTEVVPEFTADFGLRHGEKVDYAIMREEKPALLIECKKVSDPLHISGASQLARYFGVTQARIGLLTNGVVYKFFSDLEADNVMDSEPFLEIDLTATNSRDITALNYFAKPTFDADEACAAAANMKYIRGMKEYLAHAYGQPDGPFVELLARKVYTGRMTQARSEQFAGLVKLAFQGFVNDRINDTLQRATDIAYTVYDSPAVIAADEVDPGESSVESDEAEEPKDIITTVEEVAGYEIVRSIVAQVVDPERVVMRDTKSYCGVLLDDNNQRPICRLRFNAKTVKYLELIEEGRGNLGTRNTSLHRIDSPDDIVGHADRLRATVTGYLSE